ncbi:hypothetical protein [Clostridioides difficile]|uniref:hypothetical protein n=1 Tax=Clostridioides difficile TaxID=1496 RepID=UPI002A918825|nr:hypothetical protein [Clostridioides difficile]MDB3376225.1 hypothetical protein [Clostridioides difficile]MDY6679395.1 hypothetical protein [Clostridioides difficile]
MKKIFMSIVLIGVLMVTGCTQSKEIKEEQEETTVVYCSDCGDESNKVTKFCSGCGIEAKWISEKPEIEEANKNNEETEKIDEETKNTEEVKIEKDQCHNCGKYFAKNELNKFYEGVLCNTCYNLPKTCENGFVGLCEGCDDCEPENNFTYEQAINIAEKHYGVKDNDDSFITADTEPSYDSRGMYYKMWAKSKEMINQGGNGIIFAFKTYEDGTIVEY